MPSPSLNSAYCFGGCGKYFPRLLFCPLAAASDNWFVSRLPLEEPSDDFLPDAFIGRIPVRTVDQAHDFIDKLIQYEAAAPAAWMKRVLFTTGGFTSYERNLMGAERNYLVDLITAPPSAM